MDCLLGIDVGSTSMKALVYDLDGNVISRGSHPTESMANDPDHPNWQVYLPDHIWDGIASAIREAVSQMGRKIVPGGYGVTGLGADAVALDEHGEPVYPFINWICTRTTPQFERWLENVGLEQYLSDLWLAALYMEHCPAVHMVEGKRTRAGYAGSING